VIVLVDHFRSATGPNKIALPTNDSDLEEKWVMLNIVVAPLTDLCHALLCLCAEWTLNRK